MGKYGNNGWMGVDDLLDDDYYEQTNFEGYVSTAKDPGFFLLLLTITFCVGCLAVAFLQPIKEQEDEDEEIGTGYISIDSVLTVRTRKGLLEKKRYGGI